MTQAEMIYDHMMKGNEITAKQALDLFGCMRLASRIADLKKVGVPIKTEMRKVRCRNGLETRVAVYTIAKDGDADA